MKNGVLVSGPPEPEPPTRQEIYYAYRKLHSACPACGSDSIAVACAGNGFSCLGTAKDSNQAWCKCGWSGIVHDLVEKP